MTEIDWEGAPFFGRTATLRVAIGALNLIREGKEDVVIVEYSNPISPV